MLISFPRGTKMFQFPRSPLACLLNSACDARSSTRRVAPFGNPRIFACLRLPVAFRSLPRPSSAPVPRHPPCALPSLDLHRQTHLYLFPSVFPRFPPIHLPSCLFSSLVGLGGLEPPTLRLSGVRSNHLSYKPISSGGDEEIRTPDPLLARQVLSQLSYIPTCKLNST